MSESRAVVLLLKIVDTKTIFIMGGGVEQPLYAEIPPHLIT